MNVLDFFSAYEHLPVSLEDVKAFVLERTHFAEIHIFPFDFESEKLLGVCWQFIDEPHNSLNGHRKAWVLYSRSLPPEMVRVVVCKEILHLLDPVEEQARDKGQVARLIDEIVQPVELKAALQTVSDQNGMLLALAVLMPEGAIDVLRPRIEDGSLGYDTIGKLAGVPEHFVRAALSDRWPVALKLLQDRFAAIAEAAEKAAEKVAAGSMNGSGPAHPH